MADYNKLTERLLSEGYTAENFPRDKVHIANGSYSRNGNPLENIYGGFEYNRKYSDSFVYMTGCGKYVYGRKVLSNMSFMGVEWCHENDNPVIRCPYDKAECPDNDSRLHMMHGGGLCIQCWCVCHRTKEPYDFENSIEKADQERKAEMDRKYQEYSEAHNGRICKNHMFYNERTREWKLNYEPKRCAHMCFSKNGYCPVLGKELSKKRGNVYYDLKKSGILQQRENQQSLFDGERWTHITKGIRFFDKPCSMDICEAFVKIQSNEICHDYDINHSWEKLLDNTVEWEILNIRAESKPSRDLMQDLQDLQEGIKITFDEDSRKQEAESKKEKRSAAQKKKIERLEKKILETGYWNMEPHSLDCIHADKWLGADRIDELEEMRQQRLKEEREKPVQLQLSDLFGGI